MYKPPTFLAYCRRMWESHPTTAKHWARDQLIWPAVMSTVITLASALYLDKKIDWGLFRTALLLYAIVFVIYGLFQFIRAGWRMHQEQDKTISKKDAEAELIGETMTRRAEESAARITKDAGTIYKLSEGVRRVQKELDAVKVELINAKDAVEYLTWPDDRPKISFRSWGQMQMQFMPHGSNDSALLPQHGFYLANDGGAALDITVEIFDITSQLTAVGGTLARIKGNDTGFVPVWIKDEVPVSMWGLGSALLKAWEEQVESGRVYGSDPIGFPVSVVYRDYNYLWYRSRAKLIYKHKPSSMRHDISFTAAEQDKLGIKRPVLRTEFYVR